ncbi:serine hydrolase [Paraburkholderia sp. C35]|uniref:serine hydrolase n=1 Tax=Paraburkholderia sp. C35 TaxID=2126993 RepID=UPI000D6972CE|nr:serine hydrolase [Paraburkholderia sp. C35]
MNRYGSIARSAVISATIALSVVASAAHAARGDARLEYYGQSIDSMIADFMKEKHISGVTLAIVEAPYIPRVAGYGESDTTKKLLASQGTMWNIGPITQGYTAVAVMQLVEAGKMDLHAPISTYVDDLPAAWRALTIMQLLQHATGLADYRHAAAFDASRDYTPRQLLASVRDAKPAFKPGTQVSQSATNFLLLGLAIERASGMSYHDFIWSGQIKPLGLRHTMFAEDFDQHAAIDPVEQNGMRHHLFTTDGRYINPVEPAAGYRLTGGKLVDVPRNTSSSLFAFGSLWASAEDVSTWDIALAGNEVIHDAAHRDLVYKPTHLDNGTVVPAMAGWQFTKHKGFMDIKGTVPGYSAYLSRFTDPDELVCVTLLANTENVDFTDLARRIAAAYDARLGSGTDPAQTESYESVFDVQETMRRLNENIKATGAQIFAHYDHALNAQQAKLDLRPTQVVVFGNPIAGTKLMQDQQSIASALPIRVSVWEDERGRTWISYDNFERYASRYGLHDMRALEAIRTGVAEIVRKSASVYQ